jgi:hypothetical protein
VGGPARSIFRSIPRQSCGDAAGWDSCFSWQGQEGWCRGQGRQYRRQGTGSAEWWRCCCSQDTGPVQYAAGWGDIVPDMAEGVVLLMSSSCVFACIVVPGCCLHPSCQSITGRYSCLVQGASRKQQCISDGSAAQLPGTRCDLSLQCETCRRQPVPYKAASGALLDSDAEHENCSAVKISFCTGVGMPPKQRAAASLVTDPQALLGRLLLQLKVKLAGISADASARAQRECLRAAQEVEDAASQLEAGPPLLRAAMSMV